jgi:3',5'-cyclic AMP phosphodiesterase CpdA
LAGIGKFAPYELPTGKRVALGVGLIASPTEMLGRWGVDSVGEPETITLAHLSDVHLPLEAGFDVRHWNVKRVLGWLNWQRKRRFIHTRAALDLIVADLLAQRPDHILVSGDLVNIALPGEYEAALAWLHALGTPGDVSVVPGNHDIYVPLGSEPGVARWSAYMKSDAYGAEVCRACFPSTVGLSFPYVRRLGPVALVGVNSAIETPIGYALGRVGVDQLERLGRVLEHLRASGLMRLVMIHHPPLVGLAPDRRALMDAKELEQVLARAGAELVIHGHNHKVMANQLGAVQVAGIGSASAARAYHSEGAATYNVMRVSRAGIALETRGFINGGEAIGTIG